MPESARVSLMSSKESGFSIIIMGDIIERR